MLTEASSAPKFSRRPVLSGRRFTLFFIGLLLASLIFGIPVVLRFESTQDRLEQARQSWPKAAAQLNERYAAVERYCLDKKIELPREWQAAREGFRKNVMYDGQARYATELESLIRSHSEIVPKSGSNEFSAFENAMESDDLLLFEKNQNELTASHADWLGRLTDFSFRLSPPTRFEK